MNVHNAFVSQAQAAAEFIKRYVFTMFMIKRMTVKAANVENTSWHSMSTCPLSIRGKRRREKNREERVFLLSKHHFKAIHIQLYSVILPQYLPLELFSMFTLLLTYTHAQRHIQQIWYAHGTYNRLLEFSYKANYNYNRLTPTQP